MSDSAYARNGSTQHTKKIRMPHRRSLVVHCLSVLALFGSVVLSGVPTLAQDLETAYGQAASSSPVIAQARAQLEADSASKPLARHCSPM